MGMIALEKRVLLDAAGMATAEAGGAGPDPDHAPADPRDAAAERAVADTIDALGAVGPARDENAPAPTPVPATGGAGGQGRSILVVDARVRAADTLLQGLPEGVEVLRIAAGEDGIARLGQALAAGAPAEAVHILAHGEEGSFTLGARLVDADTARNELAAEFRAWSEGLTADADILLYGCDSGAGAAGRDLVRTLAALTGADVAASDDATGAAALGADWELEVTAGSVTGVSPLAEMALQAWQDRLTAPTITAPAAGYSVSEPSALNDPGASTITLTGLSIADDDYSGADDINGDPIQNATVTVTATIADTSKGSLADAGGTGTAIAGGFSFTGSRTAANAWLAQLTFTAADIETGNSAQTTSLAIAVTDAEGLQGTASIAMKVTPSSDPASVPDGAMNVVEGAASTTVTAAALALSDPELTAGTQENVQMVYRLTAAPTHGNLLKNGNLLGVGSIFTHDDVVNNRIAYQHTASGANQNAQDSFAISINDGATPQASSDTATVTVNITPVNQAPTASGSATIYEGQPANAQNANTANGGVGSYAQVGAAMSVGAGGDPGDSVTIRITSLTSRGTLFYNGTATINGVSQSIDRALTAADVNTGTGFVIAAADKANLTYVHDGSDPVGAAATDSFGFSATDAGGGLGAGAAETTAATFTINIAPVNDDPVWDDGSTLTATVTQAGPDGNAGATADNYRVVLTQAMLNATDVDSSESELSFAIVEGGPQYGQLLKNGAALAAGEAFSLADVIAGNIVYVQLTDPADPIATDSFKFAVFDNAQSLRWAAGGEDFARQGGIYDGPGAADAPTKFTFTINLADGTGSGAGGAGGGEPPEADPNQILFVGDNPTSTAGGTITEGSSGVILGDDGNGATDVMLRYTAAGVPADQIVYTIMTMALPGSLQRDTTGTGTWSGLNLFSTFTQADIDAGRIRFLHNGGEDFQGTFGFEVSAGLVDPDTLQSQTATGTFTVYVTPVNDAPGISGSSNNTMKEGETVAITTAMLDASDPDDANSAESYLENPADGNYVGDNFALNHGTGGGNPLRIRITDLPDNGVLQVDTTGAGNWVTITQAEVDGQNGNAEFDESWITGAAGTTRLRYVHSGSETTTDSFAAVAVDRRDASSGTGTISFKISSVNDAPQIAQTPSDADPTEVGRDENAIDGNDDPDDTTVKNDPVTVNEGGRVQITSTFLQAYDPDSTTKQVQYRITQEPALGYVARSTNGTDFTRLGKNAAFTTQDVLDGYIWYIHSGAELTTDGVNPDDLFKFTLADGDKEQNNNEFHIHVTPTNETPTITVPSGPIDIDSAVPGDNMIAGVSINDTDLADLVSAADGETDFLRVVVRLTQTNGTPFAALDYADVTIGIKAATGVTLDADRNGAADYLVMQGTRAQLNDALSQLSVTFGLDRNGEYRVQIIADDRLRDGAGTLTAGANGGAANEPATVGGDPDAVPATEYDYYSETPDNSSYNFALASIVVRASHTNQPPSLDNVPASITVNEDSAANAIAGISVSDLDSLSKNIQVTISVTAGEGLVTIDSTSGVTGHGTGETLTLTGTRTAINTALNTLKFTPSTDYNNQNDTQTSITLEVSDLGNIGVGGALTDTETIAVKVNRANDAPTIGANPGTQVIDSGTTKVFSAANGNLIQIDDPQDVATTVTDREFTTGQMTVTVAVTAGTVAVTTGGGAGISNNGTATVTITGTIAQVNAALDGMTFTAPNADPDDTATMTVTVDDGGNGGAGALQASLNFDIQMSASNDPPVNTLPTGFTVAEDSNWNLVRNGGGQYIQIADSDNFGSADYSVKLTSLGGQMRLQGSSNVTLSFGQGNANNSTDMTVTGTLANINTALQLLRFRPTGDLHGQAGVASITVLTTDDHPGGLADETDSDTLAIAVTPVNDDPSASGTYTVPAATEDGTGGGVVLSTLLAAAYADATDDQDGFTNATTGIAGDDGATAMSHVAIVGSTNYVAGQGSWQVQNGDGSGWIDIPVSGLSTTAALVFAADRQIRFVPAADFHGTPGTLQVRLADSSTAITASTGSADTKNLNSNGGLGNSGAWSPNGANIQTSTGNVNDAPTLTASAAAAGVEDTSPAGQTVAAIVAAQYSDATDDRTGITGGADAATALGGIAIVGNAATTEGVWQYHDGSQWVDIGEGGSAPSDGNALLLPTATLLRFVPAADYNGSPGALTIRASDSAIGTIQTGQTVSYTATGQWSQTSTIGVTVAARNDAPTIAGTATNPDIPENAGLGTGTEGLALVTGASASDAADFLYLAGDTFGGGTITVSITDGYVSGDLLSLSGTPTGVASTSGGNGEALVINLSAGATAANVATILEAIRYNSTSDNPSVYGTDADRDYSIVLSDGNNDNGTENAGGPAALTSNAITGTIVFSVLNDAPIVDLNGAAGGRDNTVTFTEGANAAGTPVKIAAGGDLSDADNQNLTQMVLTLAAVPDGASEVLNIGGTDFALAGTTYSDTDIGAFLVSYDPATRQFTIVPDGSTIATVAAFETLLQGITYLNNSDTPDPADRSITVAVTDAGLDDSAGGQADNQLGSNVATATIQVVPQNDQPRITGADPVTFLENAINAAAATIDADFGITEPDSANFNGGSLVVGGLVAGQDTVSLPQGTGFPGGPVDGQVFRDTDDNKVYVYDGGTTSWVEIGTASGGNGGNFTVSFTSDNATAARVERVLESLTFANSSHTPTLTRTLTLTLDDGDGQGSVQAANLDVTITRQNDPASVTASDVNVNEGSATLVLNAGNAAISVGDLDTPGTFSATVTVSKGTITAVGGSGGTVGGTGTATVTISGVTQAQLQARLQALTIQFVDEPAGAHGDPTRADWNGSFTVTVAVNDGGSGQTREAGAAIAGDTGDATANPGDFAYANGTDPDIVTTRTFQVTVAAVNDAPVATATTTVTTAATNEDTADADLPNSTIADIASGRFADPLDAITDGSSSDSFHGIAIVANTVDAAKGDWEYQVDGSGVWTAVGNRSIANALVLDANDKLRFNPAANFFGTATALTVRMVEDGTATGDAGAPAGGTTLDLTGATGGTTRYSANGFDIATTIAAVNDAPTVDLNGGAAGVDHTVTFTEGANAAGTPVGIATAGALADIDNANLIRMTLTVGGVSDGNAEVLTIGGQAFALDTDYDAVDIGAFTVSYAKATGIFTILPDGAVTDAVADFQTLLQGITYGNSADAPGTGNRTIDVAVTDAGIDDAGSGGGNDELASNLPRTTISVVPANDQPRISGIDPASFLENALNDAAALLDTSLTIADADSADFNGGSLVVGGLVAGQDIVSLPQGADFPGAPNDGDIFRDTDDNKVYAYNGGTASWVEIGTASGGNGGDFTIGFTSTEATRARVERVLESLTFRNTADTPTTARTLTLTLSDGDGGGSIQAADLGVTITRQNDPASVTASDVNVNEGSATITLDAGNANFTVGDLDSPGTFSATITVSKGTITAVGGSGGTVGALGGTSVTVSGATQAQLNSRLQSITVTLPDEPAKAAGDPGRADWNGSFTVTVAVDDGGSGQAREAGSTIRSDGDDPAANPGDFAYADGTNPNIVTTRTISVVVAQVNDAPVATATATVNATSVAEDTADGDLPDYTIASLAAARFADPIDEIAGGSAPDSFHGIAIVAHTVDAAKGVWEYQIDGAGGWTAVGARDIATALILDANDKLRFNPAANYFGAATTLSVRIVETGTDTGDAGLPAGGSQRDLSGATGGTSRYSANGFDITTTVTAVNDAPTVDLNGAGAGVNHTIAFTEGANVAHTPVNISAAGDLGDIDNTNLVSMTLTVGGVVDGNAEVLTIGGQSFQLGTDYTDVDIGAFRVSYASGTGIFTVTPDGGTAAALTAFETLLQGATYSNSADNPTNGDRTVQVKVQDAGIDDAGDAFNLDSNTPLTTITVTAANDQPRLVVDAATFLENALNQGALALDTSITLTDADSADFDGGSLVVSGLVAGQDIVSLPESATPPGSPVDGDVYRDSGDDTVYVHQDGSWVPIGTASGGDGGDLTISFTSTDATLQRVQWMIEALTFRNTSDTPTANRSLTLTLSDGDAGGSTAAANLPVTITPENDPTSITATAVTNGEGSATVVLDAGNAAFSVSDPDIAGGTFTTTVTVSKGTITAVGGSGGTVADLSTATVTITGATQAELISRLRALTVTLPDEAGTPERTDWNGQFTVTVVTNDTGGSGQRPGSLIGDTGDATADPGDFAYADGASAELLTTRTVTVTVTAENDAPITTSTATVTLAAIDEDLSDAANTGVTVASFAAARFDDARDQIAGGSSANGFHGIAIVANAVDATKGQWQYRLDGSTTWVDVGSRALGTALVLGSADRIRFAPAADYNGAAPNLTVRLVEDGGTGVPAGGTQVDLSGGGATGGTSRYSATGFDVALSVTAVSDPPSVDLNGTGAGTGHAVTWSENASGASTPVKIAEDAVLGDIDNTNLVRMVLTVAGLQNGNDEVLNIGGTDFALGTDTTDTDIGDYLVSVDATAGTITIAPDGAGFDALADFQALLRGITYNNTNDDPGNGARTVTVEIRDAGNDDAAGTNQLDSNQATATINVVPENNKPQIGSVDAATFLENALNQGARFLDTAIDLSDADSPHFNGGQLVVTGLVAGEDKVSLPESAAAPATPADGDVWRDTDDSKVYVRDGGAWIEIGTASGGDGADFTISFTSADATVARVERVIENLTFRNSSDTPTANRTLSITVDDGGAGGTSTAATLPVTIVPENDPARVTATDVSVTEGATTLVLDASTAAFSVADPDVATGLMNVRVTVSQGTITAIGGAGGTVAGLNSDTVTVTGATQAELIGRLQALSVTFPDAPGLADSADWNGSFSLTVVVDDTGNAGQRPGSLIDDTDAAGANPGDYDYANGTDPDLTTTRTIAVVVAAVNDAPVALDSATVTLPAVAETVTEAANTGQDIATIAASKFSDPRDAIPGGSSANAFHGIAITGNTPDSSRGAWQYQIDGSGAWTAIGARTAANALVLDANDRIRFMPAPDYNGAAPNMTAILVEDGNGAAPAGGTVVDLGSGTGGSSRYADLASAFAIATSVTAVNTAPTADSNGGAAGTDRTIQLLQTHNGPNVLDAVQLFLGVPLADRDNQNMMSVTVQVDGLRDGAAEVLRVHGQDLSLAQAQSIAVIGTVTVTVAPGGGGTATVTLSRTGGGVLAVADANAALQSMAYRNTAGSPTLAGASRSFQLSTTDAGLNDAGGGNQLASNLATVTVQTVQGNRPPVAVLDTATTDENTPVSGQALPNDSDPDGDSLAVGARTVAGSNGGSFTIRTDGSYTFDPGSDFTGLNAGESRVTEATYTISDPGGLSAVGTIRITVNGLSSAAPAPTPTPVPTPSPAPGPGPAPGPTGGPGTTPTPVFTPPVVDIPFNTGPFGDTGFGGGGFGGGGAFGESGPASQGGFTFANVNRGLGGIATAAGGGSGFGRTADPAQNPVRLTIALDAQVVGDTGAQTFSLPSNAFQHSDPSVQIRVEVTLADGSPLPKYIQFNAQTMSFMVNPDLIEPGDPRKLDLMVVGRDPDGNEASTTFTLTIGTDADDTVIENSTEVDGAQPQEGAPAPGPELEPDAVPADPDLPPDPDGQPPAEAEGQANDREAALEQLPILVDLAALDAWEGRFDEGGEAGPSGRTELQRQSLRFAFAQERQSLLDDIRRMFG